MIQVKDVSFKYEEGTGATLHDITLSIPDGQFVGITGAAGSGKSTLTYILNGIVPHCYPGDFYGSVEIDGHDTVETSLTDISRLVGSVCQDIDSQMVSSVVEDEVLFGLENIGVPKDEVEARLETALSDMGIAELRHRNIASLSGGQKQKVAVASILALAPKVLVLDEPTAELDPASSRAVFELLAACAREKKITVVVVEQKIALLGEYCDRLLVVEDGKIALDGACREVFDSSERLFNAGINCPRSTSLVNRLRESGLYCGPACRNVAEATVVLEEVLA